MSDQKKSLNVGLHMVKPFGPVVMQVKMEPEYVDWINKYHDTVRADKIKNKELDYSHALVGNVEKEIEIPGKNLTEVMPGGKVPSLAEYLSKLTEQYIQRVDKMQTQDPVSSLTNQSHVPFEKGIKTGGPKELQLVTLMSAWTVAQYKGDYNPVHKHHGTVSCVTWTKVPECIEKGNERDEAGFFVLMDGFRSNLCANLYAIKPQVGLMLFFPSWLHHAVYPFRGEGERRSFSANLLAVPKEEKDLLNLGVFILDKKTLEEHVAKKKRREEENAPKS